MAYISVRIPDDEKTEIKKYAQFCGYSVSHLIRKLFIEKMEEEEDIQAIHEYEKNKANGTLQTFSHEEVGRMLNIG